MAEQMELSQSQVLAAQRWMEDEAGMERASRERGRRSSNERIAPSPRRSSRLSTRWKRTHSVQQDGAPARPLVS